MTTKRRTQTADARYLGSLRSRIEVLRDDPVKNKDELAIWVGLERQITAALERKDQLAVRQAELAAQFKGGA